MRIMRHLVRPTHVGVGVAVWYAGKILIVRHSYRMGYWLPGGRVKRHENPTLAACRELREEVGIIAGPGELTPVRKDLWTRNHRLFEFRPKHKPVVRIDNREIVEARFVEPKEACRLDIPRDSHLGAMLREIRDPEAEHRGVP